MRAAPAHRRAVRPGDRGRMRPDSLAAVDRSKARSWAEWKRCSGFFSRQWRMIRSSAGEMSRFAVEISGGSSLQDRRHRVGGRVPAKGALAGKHLVENRAEGEDVRSDIGRPSPHLFRRHVIERPQHDSRLRAGGGRRRLRERTGFGLQPCQLGESEIEDLEPAVFGDEEVLGLQVPMNDSFVVGCGETLCHLEGVVDGLSRREPFIGQNFAQRLSFQKLADDVGRSLVRPDVVNGNDVGVLRTPAALASCSKRRRRSGSFEKEAGRTLIATSRLSRGSLAR